MTIETLNLESLASKAAFLSLKFSVFGNLRKAHVEAKTDANQKRFKHSKQLLESPELLAISRADVAIKEAIKNYCLPSNIDAGLRSVPNDNLNVVCEMLDEYQDVTRPALVEAFLAVYPDQIKTAEKELKEHFNSLHYLSVDEMREEFVFEYHIVTFGQPPDHLKAFAPKLFEKEKAKAHKLIVDAANDIAQAMRATAFGLVNKLADTLKPSETDGKQKKFFGAHIDNVKEFLNGFDIRNVTDDAGLKAEMDKLKQLMDGVDAEKVRHSDTLKIELSSQVSEIAKQLSSMVEVKGRKFRDAPVAQPEPEPEAVPAQ